MKAPAAPPTAQISPRVTIVTPKPISGLIQASMAEATAMPAGSVQSRFPSVPPNVVAVI